MEYKSYSKEKSREAIKRLVDQFDADFGDNKNPNMKEAQLEDKYIKPLFSFLNWNIHNEGIDKGREEFRVQTSHKINEITKEPDYELWLPDKNGLRMKRILFMEAKDPRYDLSKEIKCIRQAYQYAHSSLSLSDHSSNRTNLAILTDFEEFRLFDCSNPYPLTKNEAALFNKQIVRNFDLYYSDYVTEFNIIWDIFERNNVYHGSLEEFRIKDEDLRKNRKAPDLHFLDDLKKWRLQFAGSMLKTNNDVSTDFLTSASQLLLNRIIFLKMLSDREIEKDYLSRILDKLSEGSANVSIYDSCRDIFNNLEKKYNGEIFKRRKEFDHVKIENKVIEQVIKSLRPEKSVYTFSAMPVEIIGRAYEQFLGEVIVRKKHGLASEQKPDVQKAGGVYYTPRYIVDYIVENTVDEKLKDCQSPEDVQKIKILDPACGSGSFLISAYDHLLEWHINYYKYELDKMHKRGSSVSEIKKKFRHKIKYYPASSNNLNNRYIVRLTSKLKKEILKNNIFGVDIDFNAVEIAKFSLNMKALANSTREELYEDVDLFNEKILPSLDSNIKCGNSLIGLDFYENHQENSIEKISSVNAFDWNAEFPEIMRNGGFSAVIGNPPYLSMEDMEQIHRDYYYGKNIGNINRYKTAMHKSNLYSIFLERAITLASKDSLIGFITPYSWLSNSSFVNLREIFVTETTIKTMHFFPVGVFQDAGIATGIIILNKRLPKNAIASVFDLRSFPVDELANSLSVNSIEKRIPIDVFKKSSDYIFNISWDEKETSIFEKIEQFPINLGKLVNIDRGCDTANNKKYTGYDNIYNRNSKRLLSGRCFTRFSHNWDGLYLYYEPERMKADKATARPGKPERFEQNEKLIVYRFLNKRKGFICVYDNEQFYCLGSCYVLSPIVSATISMRYLAGILNSRLIAFYNGKIFNGVKVTRTEMLRIPIPIDSKEEENISRVVENLLVLKAKLQEATLEIQRTQIQRNINHTEKKMNELVYEIYGLNQGEIAMVEGS